MMMAIAFESIVKLAALLAVGPFVVWGLFDGPGDLAAAVERTVHNPALTALSLNGNWLAITVLSGLAFLCLPRQFHVAVVEHDHPRSLNRARWMFPLYMLLINLFVVPIALGPRLLGRAQSRPARAVAALRQRLLSIFVSSADCRRQPAWSRRLHGPLRHGRHRVAMPLILGAKKT
jgi:Na+/proline symporter